MLHKEFWGLVFLAFVVWVFVAGNPQQRIEHACRPVGWSGNVVTSLSALVLPQHQQKVQGWFDGVEYGCRYTTWRLFYQDEYNKYMEAQKAAAAKAPASPASAPAAAPAPAPAPASK